MAAALSVCGRPTCAGATPRRPHHLPPPQGVRERACPLRPVHRRRQLLRRAPAARVYCSNCRHDFLVIIAFVLDRPAIERILDHIGESTQSPVMLPARSPPQLAFGFDETTATSDWPEMDLAAGQSDGWE